MLSSGVGRPSLPPPLVYAGGLLGAALAGVGIGLMIPTPQRPEDEWREKKRRLVERWEGGKGGEGARGGEGGGGEEGRRHSTVYEDAREIADEIPRPAMIRDVERSELESRYEFISCLASGGSATVWKAVERESGRLVAIKVVDKKLLPASLLNMEVHSMQRCAGHPNIVQLLAAYELEGDEANPNGEWHLVMELAEGGELTGLPLAGITLGAAHLTLPLACDPPSPSPAASPSPSTSTSAFTCPAVTVLLLHPCFIPARSLSS